MFGGGQQPAVVLRPPGPGTLGQVQTQPAPAPPPQFASTFAGGILQGVNASWQQASGGEGFLASSRQLGTAFGGGGGPSTSSPSRMQAIAGPALVGRSHSGGPRPAQPLHLFQKTLRDLITGMRQHKNPSDQQRFVTKCLAEAREEARRAQRVGCRLSGRRILMSSFPAQARSTDVRTKAGAIEKLTYLHMNGHDMAWAAFHVVEARRAGGFAPAARLTSPPR